MTYQTGTGSLLAMGILTSWLLKNMTVIITEEIRDHEIVRAPRKALMFIGMKHYRGHDRKMSLGTIKYQT